MIRTNLESVYWPFELQNINSKVTLCQRYFSVYFLQLNQLQFDGNNATVINCFYPCLVWLLITCKYNTPTTPHFNKTEINSQKPANHSAMSSSTGRFTNVNPLKSCSPFCIDALSISGDLATDSANFIYFCFKIL